MEKSNLIGLNNNNSLPSVLLILLIISIIVSACEPADDTMETQIDFESTKDPSELDRINDNQLTFILNFTNRLLIETYQKENCEHFINLDRNNGGSLHKILDSELPSFCLTQITNDYSISFFHKKKNNIKILVPKFIKISTGQNLEIKGKVIFSLSEDSTSLLFSTDKYADNSQFDGLTNVGSIILMNNDFVPKIHYRFNNGELFYIQNYQFDTDKNYLGEQALKVRSGMNLRNIQNFEELKDSLDHYNHYSGEQFWVEPGLNHSYFSLPVWFLETNHYKKK